MAIKEKVTPNFTRIFYSGIRKRYVLKMANSKTVARDFPHEADALMCSIRLGCKFYWNPLKPYARNW